MRGLVKAQGKGAAAERRSTRKASATARHRGNIVASANSATSSQASVEARAFHDLLEYAKLQPCMVDIKHCGSLNGNGLIAKKKTDKGEVLLSVPKGLCIILDYNTGLKIAQGAWPRLQEGVSRGEPEPLTWDLLMALALMDALAGDGDPFWGAWAQAVLPPPEALCLPMCWSAARLAALQHDAIVDGATKQQARLKGLFPALCDPVDVDSTSWLAWAFACVRSRAFKLNEETFAFVPFLDIANHSLKPNAGFRLEPSSGAVQLVALQELGAGQEVTISYSGPEGYTNQRYMAQYGFVPAGGNPADRVLFDVPQGSAGLDLERVQDRLGDKIFMDAVSARNPYLHAALKSLPFNVGGDAEAAAVDINNPNGSGAAVAAAKAGSAGMDPSLALAKKLQEQQRAMVAAFPTTQESDEAELDKLQSDPQSDPRDIAALLYRTERKKLLHAVGTLLDVYVRD